MYPPGISAITGVILERLIYLCLKIKLNDNTIRRLLTDLE